MNDKIKEAVIKHPVRVTPLTDRSLYVGDLCRDTENQVWAIMELNLPSALKLGHPLGVFVGLYPSGFEPKMEDFQKWFDTLPTIELAEVSTAP